MLNQIADLLLKKVPEKVQANILNKLEIVKLLKFRALTNSL